MKVGAPLAIDVQEDALGNATSNPANNPDSDLSIGNLEGTNQTDSASFTTAALQALVNPGADEPVTFALTTFAGDTTAVLDKQGNQISSDRKLVFYHQVSPTDVIGYADVDGSGTFNAATDPAWRLS